MEPAYGISDACVAAYKVAGLHGSLQLADHPQRVCLQISGVSGLFEYEEAVHLFKVGGPAQGCAGVGRHSSHTAHALQLNCWVVQL